ncbi:MAG: acylphosphatase [Desulfovibrionales bacterium]
MVKSLHCVVTGKVQGVNFRSETQSYASAHHLTGWVRNLDSDKVEVLAQGEETSLEELKKFLVRGSAMSKVEHVECDTIDYDKDYDAFQIR